MKKKIVDTMLPMENLCRYYCSMGEFVYTIVRMSPNKYCCMLKTNRRIIVHTLLKALKSTMKTFLNDYFWESFHC